MKKCSICKSDNVLIFCSDCNTFERVNKLNPNFYKKEYREGLPEKLDKSYYDSRKLVNAERLKFLFNHVEMLRNLSSLNYHSLKSLDIGCSEGSFVELMKHKGFDSYGVEPSQYAKFNDELNIFNGELKNFKIDMKFDVITLFHVLEHVDNIKECLNQIFDLLSDEGVLFIEVPNMNCNYCSSSDFIPEHNYFFEAKGLFKLLESKGFNVLSVSSCSEDTDVVPKKVGLVFKDSVVLKKVYHLFLPFINKLRFGRYDKKLEGSNLRIIAQK